VRTVSSAYAAAVANLNRIPVYTAEIEGDDTIYSTHPLVDYTSEILADLPSLYLRLNESSGTSAADSSGNGLTGTLFNTPTLGVAGGLTGCSSTAMTLAAASFEYITVADNALLDPGDTFTIKIRVKFTTLPGGGAFYDLVDKGTNGYRVTVNGSGTVFLVKGGGSTICSNASPQNMTTGVWYEIAITKAGSVFHVYINGVESTTSFGNQTIAGTATNLNIGRNSGATSYLNGTIQELALYPTALSPSRILAHYQAGLALHDLTGVLDCMNAPVGFAAKVEPDRGRSWIGSAVLNLRDKSTYDAEVLSDSPAFYLGDAPKAGATWPDLGDNNLDATLVATPVLGNGGPLQGIPNLCVTLDGSTQYINRADDAALDPGDTFTLEIWAYPTSVSSNRTLLSKDTGGYYLALQGGQILLNKYGTGDIVLSTSAAAASTWSHIVCTKSGPAVKTYLNGVDVTGVITNQTIAATASALRIGTTNAGSSWFVGSLARPAIYPTALSAERVLAHYNSGKYNIGTRGAITRMVTGTIGNKTVAVKQGFIGLQYEEFDDMPGGVIADFGRDRSLTAYDLKVQEPQSLVNREIFQCGTTILDADITDTDTSLTIPAGGADFFLSAGFIQIDEEKIYYDPSASTSLSGLLRGQLGTTAAAHTAGAVITEVLKIGPAHPITILDYTYQAIDKRGLSIASAMLDRAAITAASIATGDISMMFLVTEAVNAKDWIEQEILSKIGCYAVTRNGKLSIVQYDAPDPLDSVATLTHDNIAKNGQGLPALSWQGNFGTTINSIVFQYDYDPLTGTFKTTSEPYEDAASIAAYGLYRVTIQSKGMRSPLFRRSDDFDRANSNSLGTDWTESEDAVGRIKIASNQLWMGSTAASGDGDGIAYRNDTVDSSVDIYSPNQCSELTFKASTNSGYSGPAVALFGAYNSCFGYAAIYDKGNSLMYLKSYFALVNLETAGPLAGADVVAPVACTLVDGDRVGIRISGIGETSLGYLSVMVNDVAIMSASSVTWYAGASPGVVVNCADGHDAQWENWRGGDDVGNVGAMLTDISGRILARYSSGGVPSVNGRLLLQNSILEAGDIVKLTTPVLPDKSTRTLGITDALFEVTSCEPQPDAGEMDVELLQTGWNL
jgi:hypothetical protein